MSFGGSPQPSADRRVPRGVELPCGDIPYIMRVGNVFWCLTSRRSAVIAGAPIIVWRSLAKRLGELWRCSPPYTSLFPRLAHFIQGVLSLSEAGRLTAVARTVQGLDVLKCRGRWPAK